MQVTHINENSVVDLHFQECLEQLKWGPQVQHSFKQFATVANGYVTACTLITIVLSVDASA
jgi:hypothetical protein